MNKLFRVGLAAVLGGCIGTQRIEPILTVQPCIEIENSRDETAVSLYFRTKSGIGSFQVNAFYNSALYQGVVREGVATEGLVVYNSQIPGIVRVAGATAHRFPQERAAVDFVLKKRGTVSAPDSIFVTELNSDKLQDLLFYTRPVIACR